MMNDSLQAVIRHVGGFVGAYLATNGWISDGQVELFTGLLLAAAALAWSFWDKKNRNT